MKTSVIGIMMGIMGAMDAQGMNTKDLALQCDATYKVLSSVAYVIPAHHRVPDIQGLAEVKEVLRVEGKDCSLLQSHYQLSIKPGQKIGTTKIPAGAVDITESGRAGQTYVQGVNQYFTYAVKGGDLPLFPLVHKESAELLGITGEVNAEQLYGTPNFSALDEQQKSNILGLVLAELEFGKKFQRYSSYYESSFFQLLLNLDFHSEIGKKEYLGELLLVFSNSAKFESSPTSFAPQVLLGWKINALIQEVGGTKWQSKMEIYKKNPLLFADQILSWADPKNHQAPNLDVGEIESYLEFALDMGKKLKEVDHLTEARYLLEQYKNSAANLKKHSPDSETNWAGPKYNLSKYALDLIIQITNL